MASLKEVKNRISSVKSTQKITSAMKMVASSKLHRAQQAIESMLPYEHSLDRIMSSFVAASEGEIDSPFSAQRDVKKIALVAFSSNSSLCGAFNANVVKLLANTVDEYKSKGVQVQVGVVGKKIADTARKAGYEVAFDASEQLDHPAYDAAAKLADTLMTSFIEGEIDKVQLIYHHFKSTASQALIKSDFLPISLDTKNVDEGKVDDTKGESQHILANYLFEPSLKELAKDLIPHTLKLKLYTALLDTLASEHAARVIAMQLATDNADELLRDLTLTYNKTRQQAITTELLDIVGGSMH